MPREAIVCLVTRYLHRIMDSNYMGKRTKRTAVTYVRVTDARRLVIPLKTVVSREIFDR